jgi:hypothetical protein
MAKRNPSDEKPADTSVFGRLFPRRDPRIRALNSVWASAIAMLALCIPICIETGSLILPILVIVGTAVVSLYVWQGGGAERKEDEADALRTKIQELEDRLANVEIINRFEDRLAEKRLRQESEQSGAPPRSQKSEPTPDL